MCRFVQTPCACTCYNVWGSLARVCGVHVFCLFDVFPFDQSETFLIFFMSVVSACTSQFRWGDLFTFFGVVCCSHPPSATTNRSPNPKWLGLDHPQFLSQKKCEGLRTVHPPSRCPFCDPQTSACFRFRVT